MFSRKKSKPFVKFDREERRMAVRIQPDQNLKTILKEKRREVMDISTTGIAIQDISIPVGTKVTLRLELPHNTIQVHAKVVKDDGCCCHCIFIDLAEGQTEQLYQYILEVQKSRIRKSFIA